MKISFLILLSLAFVGCTPASREPAAPSSQPASADAGSDAVSPEAAAAAPRIEKPPTFQKGYKLTFRSRTSTYDVTYQGEEDGMLVFHYDTRGKLPFDRLYTRDLKMVGINDAQRETRFTPPVGNVDFPLYVGKKWEVAYKATSNQQQSTGQTSVEVLAFEPVQVPYGTVDAFRIRVRNTSRQISRMNPYETYWYSPDIGFFVKHETNKPVYEDPFELIAVSK
jgi:hypothetical protein